MNISELSDKITLKVAAEAERLGEKIPYIPDSNGKYTDTDNICWWTNGFWAGMLWQLYHASGNELFRKTAECSEKQIGRASCRERV